MHRASINRHSKKGHLRVPPPSAGIPVDYSTRATDQGLEFQRNLMALFPDSIVSLSGNKMEIFTPGKATFWNRNPLGEKYVIRFNEDVLDIGYVKGNSRTKYGGGVDPDVRNMIKEAMWEAYPD